MKLSFSFKLLTIASLTFSSLVAYAEDQKTTFQKQVDALGTKESALETDIGGRLTDISQKMEDQTNDKITQGNDKQDVSKANDNLKAQTAQHGANSKDAAAARKALRDAELKLYKSDAVVKSDGKEIGKDIHLNYQDSAKVKAIDKQKGDLRAAEDKAAQARAVLAEKQSHAIELKKQDAANTQIKKVGILENKNKKIDGKIGDLKTQATKLENKAQTNGDKVQAAIDAKAGDQKSLAGAKSDYAKAIKDHGVNSKDANQAKSVVQKDKKDVTKDKGDLEVARDKVSQDNKAAEAKNKAAKILVGQETKNLNKISTVSATPAEAKAAQQLKDDTHAIKAIQNTDSVTQKRVDNLQNKSDKLAKVVSDKTTQAETAKAAKIQAQADLAAATTAKQKTVAAKEIKATTAEIKAIDAVVGKDKKKIDTINNTTKDLNANITNNTQTAAAIAQQGVAVVKAEAKAAHQTAVVQKQITQIQTQQAAVAAASTTAVTNQTNANMQKTAAVAQRTVDVATVTDDKAAVRAARAALASAKILNTGDAAGVAAVTAAKTQLADQKAAEHDAAVAARQAAEALAKADAEAKRAQAQLDADAAKAKRLDAKEAKAAAKAAKLAGGT